MPDHIFNALKQAAKLLRQAAYIGGGSIPRFLKFNDEHWGDAARDLIAEIDTIVSEEEKDVHTEQCCLKHGCNHNKRVKRLPSVGRILRDGVWERVCTCEDTSSWGAIFPEYCARCGGLFQILHWHKPNPQNIQEGGK